MCVSRLLEYRAEYSTIRHKGVDLEKKYPYWSSSLGLRGQTEKGVKHWSGSVYSRPRGLMAKSAKRLKPLVDTRPKVGNADNI